MADIESASLQFAVMGSPVAHSKSPRIHTLFAHQFKHRIEYTAIEVDPGGFAQALAQFRAAGGRGLNVTVPFKLDAFRLADHLSDRAKLAGAVNTIRFEPDGTVFGDNTDGAGLVHDLTKNLEVAIKDKKVLVLGAGGAVRGVLAPLLKHHPALLVIANRTVSKGKELAEEFAHFGRIEACGFNELKGKRFDIVINGTAASLKGEVPPLPENLFANHALAYDMMYGDKATPFMDWAALHGAERIADGLGMLVEQAAESYLVWHGVRPETKSVIAALRKGG
ncbi:MAG: shikimate dehydrogenase [Candidatus Muproteobacteria bacterium RBG_16_65_34]|uniref:Shikimate dehydrogenase (NADP(+)) n=1 Tax=Candidatus Muproteobacteria bacterium RBG_16_65_34 TaxID=1817760 RepID=A0A1F6TTJ1_9PROT|nr:MAG: shikimate dehydrogenase [Candidatus Muproteobacteria bacterium RBG_16_65_34]